ncbi:MAG: Ig-like domain-containing protein, partial [Verrucomicrobiota bacterium]
PRLLAASDTGVSDSDRITAAAVLTVVGSGLSGEVVTLHDGITALGSTVVSAGAWSLTISGLAQGDHDLTVVLTDSSGNRSVPSDTLRVRIDRTAPVVSQIPSPNLGAGASLDIPFIIGDSQADPADLSVQVSSSSPSLLPNSGLVLSGTGPSRSLRVSPAVSLVGGVVDITLSVRDVAGNTATPTFRLSVQAPNRPPTLDRIPMQTVQAGSGAHLVRLTGVTAGLGETQNLTLRSVSDNPALVADPLAFQTLPVGSGALVLVPAASGSGTARISVILSDDGGTAFGGIDAVTNTFAVTVAPANPDGSARIQGIVRRFDGSLELTVVLPTGRPYLLQESTDLRSWADGPVFTPLISPHSLVVPGTDDVLEKFFRVIASP